MSNPYVSYLYRLNNQFTNIFVIAYSSIGIPCNILSIIIFYRLTRIKNNMGFLYICQSIVDIIVLLVNLILVRSSPLIFPSNLTNLTDELCKTITFLRRLTLHMSSWITVLITFDRFIFIFYKNQFKQMQNRRFLVGLILVNFTILAALDIPNLLFYLSLNRNVTFSSYKTCSADFEVVIASDMISLLMRTYIPFFVMLILNAIMIRKIAMSSRRVSLRQTLSHHRKDYQFTISVMFVDVFFFVTNLPESVFNLVYDYNLYSGNLANSTVRAYFNLLSGIFSSVSLSVQTFSFFIYIAFNLIFRREIIDLFASLKKKRIIAPIKTIQVVPVNHHQK